MACSRGRVVVWSGGVRGAAAGAAFLFALVFATPALAGGQANQTGTAPTAAPEAQAATPADDVPVVTVVGERQDLTEADRRRIYRDLAKGLSLYADKNFKEAFPYLLNTAERGFKHSQARVGHIYAYGLGDVERDTPQAVGWLGVASSGTSSHTIKNYFNTIWQRIPEQYVPYFEEVVDEYKTKYGERATGVVCEMHRPARSHIRRLGCVFQKDIDEQTEGALGDFFTAQQQRRLHLEAEEQLRIAEQQLGDTIGEPPE